MRARRHSRDRSRSPKRARRLAGGFLAATAQALALLCGLALAGGAATLAAPAAGHGSSHLPLADLRPAALLRAWTAQTQPPGAPAAGDEADSVSRGKPSVRLDFNFKQDSGSERVAVGDSIHVKSDERVQQVVVVLGSATIEGRVDGDVVIVAGEARIDGLVRGQMVSILSTVNLGPGADIRGEVVNVGKPLQIDPAAKLASPVKDFRFGGLGLRWEAFQKHILQGVLLRPLPPGTRWAWTIGALFFVLHLLVALLLPQPVRACVQTLTTQPVRSIFVGLLIAVLALPALVLLLPTVVGPPLLLCLLMVASLLGKVGVYAATGNQVVRLLRLGPPTLPAISFCVGAALFYLAFMVPIVGWLAWFLITPLGIGAAFLAAATALSKEGHSLQAAAQPAAAPPTALTTLNVTMPSDAPGGEGHSLASPPGPQASETAPAVAPPKPAAATQPGATSVPPKLEWSPTELATLPRVGFWPRLAATVIDYIPLAIVSSIFGGFPAIVVLAAAYFIGLWVWRGTTVGGILLGLKVVRLDARPLDWQTAIVRSLGASLSFCVAGIGFFWASWSQERQSWHDIIAGTTVVKLPRRESLV
jgi:uncharacterized RDD family membrane protein YckC